MKPQNCNSATAAQTWASLAEHILKEVDAHSRAMPVKSVQEESSEVVTHQSTLQLTDDRQAMLVMK